MKPIRWQRPYLTSARPNDGAIDANLYLEVSGMISWSNCISRLGRSLEDALEKQTEDWLRDDLHG